LMSLMSLRSLRSLRSLSLRSLLVALSLVFLGAEESLSGAAAAA